MLLSIPHSGCTLPVIPLALGRPSITGVRLSEENSRWPGLCFFFSFNWFSSCFTLFPLQLNQIERERSTKNTRGTTIGFLHQELQCEKHERSEKKWRVISERSDRMLSSFVSLLFIPHTAAVTFWNSLKAQVKEEKWSERVRNERRERHTPFTSFPSFHFAFHLIGCYCGPCFVVFKLKRKESTHSFLTCLSFAFI